MQASLEREKHILHIPGPFEQLITRDNTLTAPNPAHAWVSGPPSTGYARIATRVFELDVGRLAVTILIIATG
ncbi:hypothetical protein U1Q18_049834 [Sarracenia purpurea var. burkii]